MHLIRPKLLLLSAILTSAAAFSASAAQEEAGEISNAGRGSTTSVTTTAPPPGWLERDTLTGDWDGARSWLNDYGITLKPRLTQFYQGMPSGDGDHGFEYGGKTDLLVNADLGKLGFWDGFSMIVHAEYNYGASVNGYGGTIALVNTALYFPGIEGADRFDMSSVYLAQKFGDSVVLLAGKINIIDIAATRPFAGGAGIDSFWNVVFVSPPAAQSPPVPLGCFAQWNTEVATFGLSVYDPRTTWRTEYLSLRVRRRRHGPRES